MKSIFPQHFLIVLVVIFSSCGPDYTLWTKKYCLLERLEYQQITDTISRRKESGIEGGVKVNGKAIFSEKINLDTVNAELKAGNKVFINENTFRTVQVSQEFYQKYNENRSYLCDLIDGMKSGIISTDTGKARAEAMYLDMVQMFSGLDKQ